MIYLDNSATTKPCREAVEAMTNALTVSWANPSALYTFGLDASHALRTARHQVAAAMGVDCALVARGHQGREKLETCRAIAVTDTLTELSRILFDD